MPYGQKEVKSRLATTAKFTQCTKYNILTQKVPIQKVFLVVMIAMDIKRSNFYFCKKGYPYVCTTVKFNLTFLTLSMVQECLKHPRGYFSFLQNKLLTFVRFK